ncbi:MAG: hypothetical protein JNL82_00975 [Myxococcales bacterium]|nr:hypothetical protein [Myxococcales bacterium]
MLPLALGGLPAHVAASPPPAQPATSTPPASTDDVVQLKNGGMVRGRILEVLPGDSVTVSSAATGETRRFAWSELTSIEQGGTRTEVAAVGAHEAVHAKPGAPRLHIELTRPVDLKLFEVAGEVHSFIMGPFSADAIRPVCVAPCDLVVDGSRGQSFFFDGKRVTKSREFSLSEYNGDVVARVRPGRPGLLGGGIAVMSLGVAGLSGSAFLFLKERSKILDHKYDNSEQPTMFAGPNYAPATALLISGALVLAGGLAMALLSRTRVAWSQRTTAARRRPAGRG